MLFSFGLGLRCPASADLNVISALHFFPRFSSEVWAVAQPQANLQALLESKVQQDTERVEKQLLLGGINAKCERIWRGPEKEPWQSNPDSTHCPQGCLWSWWVPLHGNLSGAVGSQKELSNQYTQHSPAWDSRKSCLIRIAYLLKVKYGLLCVSLHSV